MQVDICIGVPIYNGGKYLEDSMRCLLQQTHRNFKIIALNDGSSDNSDLIMRDIASRDDRILYVSHETRTGMIRAWRKIAELAREHYNPRFFAWYSDHDLVEPNWLEELYNVMHNDVNSVCAYAKTVRISQDGSLLSAPIKPNFHSKGVPVWDRIRQVTSTVTGYGDIVYGLLRLDILEKCGIFRGELFPDRLLVTEMSVYGDINYVTTTTRSRRILEFPTNNDDLVKRQLHILFPDGYVKNSPLTSHATSLFLAAMDPKLASEPEIQFRRMYQAWPYYIRIMGKFRMSILEELKYTDGNEGVEEYLKLFLLQTKCKDSFPHNKFRKLRQEYRWTKFFGIAGLLAYKLYTNQLVSRTLKVIKLKFNQNKPG